jgi:excinuclease UvrABC ATPase subunit
MNKQRECNNCSGKRLCKECYARMSDEELIKTSNNTMNNDVVMDKLAHFKRKKAEVAMMEKGIENVQQRMLVMQLQCRKGEKRKKAGAQT